MRIGIVGDYTPSFESHVATTNAILMAARSIGLDATVKWLLTADVSDYTLSHYDGVWASPGSPYRSLDGMLCAIRYARERLRPMRAT